MLTTLDLGMNAINTIRAVPQNDDSIISFAQRH
jgi:hypothetical protein